MIESDKRTTSFEERFMFKLTQPPPQINTKMVEDDEIGIFGAEKYFKGDIDDQLLRTPSNKSAPRYHPNEPPQKHQERCPAPKPKTPSAPPSVRSESSWNSQKGLLVNDGNNHKRKSCVKSLLATLRCNCNDKASVKIIDNRVHVKEPAKQPVFKTGDLLSSRWPNEMKMKREDCFSFPVLTSSIPVLPETETESDIPIPHVRTQRSSSEAFGSPVSEKGKKSFSLERKLTKLNWDGVTPRAEMIDVSRNGGNNDAASDASSDLFEIESFSTNDYNSFLARQAMEINSDGRPSNVNGYAPSEASVDWSVVTASVAEFSTLEDTGSRGVNFKDSGILSGCKNHRSVRVSGDQHYMTGGGDKAAITAAPAMREWCHRLDSATPVAKIQAETKLLGSGFDSHRGQHGFGTTRPHG